MTILAFEKGILKSRQSGISLDRSQIDYLKDSLDISLDRSQMIQSLVQFSNDTINEAQFYKYIEKLMRQAEERKSVH